MTRQWTAQKADDLDTIAREIFKTYPDLRLYTLEGDLGSGKTSFVKAFGKALGLEETISSPSFAIIQEYGEPVAIYHFDLYRLKDPEELLEIGFEDYLFSPCFVFIEWPSIAERWLKDHTVAKIDIQIMDNNNRLVNLVI
jgi:tRNA threonylcarbamoyladenosine biosynthesis protein TsaE